MPSETDKRVALARRVVDHLAANTELRVSLLAGSVASDTSDEHSDVDLLNYYDELPDPELFDRSIRDLGVDSSLPIGVGGPDGFVSSYWIEGVELQTGAQSIASLERRLQRIEASDVDWATAKVAMGLLEALPLHGASLVRRWQARAAYPDALRRREVEANLGIFPIWALDAHLAVRDAELFRRQMLLDGAFRVVAVLSAINRLYFSTFQFKRARAHAAQMKVKPEHLVERLDGVANLAPSEAAAVLQGLVSDTKAIVSREMPEVDVDVRWRPPQPEP